MATDGSDDAMIAAQAAVALADDTGAELHVDHVGERQPYYAAPTAGPTLPSETRAEIERRARGLLDEQVEEVKQAGGRSRKPTCGSAKRTRRSSA